MSAAPSRTLSVDSAHPSLPGHFPGMPVVPGVVLLSQVLADLRVQFPTLRVAGVKKLKFLRMLLPDRHFSVEFEPADAVSMRFKCWQEDAVLAEGRLTVLAPESETVQRPGLRA